MFNPQRDVSPIGNILCTLRCLLSKCQRMGDESKWVHESKYSFGNQVVFDYDVTNTYPNIFNHKYEIYGVETYYSQILVCKLYSAFQTTQQSYDRIPLTRCLLTYGRLGNLNLQCFKVKFLGLAEVMLFGMAQTSVKPLLSCGLKGFKLYIHGGKEVTHGPAVSPNCILCVPLFGLEACRHWLWQEFLFLFSDYIDRSGMLPSLWSSAKDASVCVCSGQQHSQGNETQTKHLAHLGT